jgi:reverse gyrase
MKALVIKPKNPSELKFLEDLLKKLGINSSSLSLEELEDVGMSKLLRQVDRSKKASRKEIMKKLTA